MPELLLVLAGLLGCYLVSCLVKPYTRCLFCSGGKHLRSDGQVWSRCRRCGGNGQRRRFGAVVLRRG